MYIINSYGVLMRILDLTVQLFAFPYKEALSCWRGWTQLVRIKLPVAMALVYLSSAPAPAIPLVYSKSVCVCVCV